MSNDKPTPFDLAEELRTVLRWEEKRMGAVSAGVMRKIIAALDDSEIKQMRDALENLEVQAVRGMVQGWVCIPEVEWDAVMVPNA